MILGCRILQLTVNLSLLKGSVIHLSIHKISKPIEIVCRCEGKHDDICRGVVP